LGNLIKNLIKAIFFIIIINFLNPYSIRSADEIDTFISANEKLNLKEENYQNPYILGPGDYLFIQFYGVKPFSREYFIDREGFLFLPEIGKFYGSGKTINELKQELINAYKEYIIQPEIDIYITIYRPISVYIYGEVNSPGLYNFIRKNRVSKDNLSFDFDNNIELDSMENDQNLLPPKIYNAIKFAKGVTNNADLSNIEVVRTNSKSQGGGKIKTSLNLLETITSGSQNQNIALMDGDSIYIPKSDVVLKDQVLAINRTNLNPDKIIVYVTGNVIKSGPAPLKKGSTLLQAIASTGGKKLMTGSIQFIRFNKNGKTYKSIFRYDPNAPINSAKNPILMDGDIINVRKTLLGNVTEVLGDVSPPILSGYGLYSIFD